MSAASSVFGVDQQIQNVHVLPSECVESAVEVERSKSALSRRLMSNAVVTVYC